MANRTLTTNKKSRIRQNVKISKNRVQVFYFGISFVIIAVKRLASQLTAVA